MAKLGMTVPGLVGYGRARSGSVWRGENSGEPMVRHLGEAWFD